MKQRKSTFLMHPQRIATLIVYLNNLGPSSGGATVFKDLASMSSSSMSMNTGPLAVRPEKGKALLFYPSYADGRPDDRTMHAGQVAMVIFLYPRHR